MQYRLRRMRAQCLASALLLLHQRNFRSECFRSSCLDIFPDFILRKTNSLSRGNNNIVEKFFVPSDVSPPYLAASRRRIAMPQGEALKRHSPCSYFSLCCRIGRHFSPLSLAVCEARSRRQKLSRTVVYYDYDARGQYGASRASGKTLSWGVPRDDKSDAPRSRSRGSRSTVRHRECLH